MTQQDFTREQLPVCSLSDLPRLLCGCPQHAAWTPDPDDLEPAELAYLKGDTAQGPASPPRHHQITPVALPNYGKARPWSTAVNVDLPSTGRTCGACGDRPAGDAFICPECADDLRIHFGDVPGLLDDLDVLGQREAVVNTRPQDKDASNQRTKWDDVLRPDPKDPVNPTVGQQLAAAGYHRPLHVERAVNARRRLHLQVALAVKVVHGKHARTTDTRNASRSLLSHLDTLAGSTAAPDVARGMQRAHDRAMATIDNVEDGVYLGLCDHCKAPMHADPDQAEHKCTTCSHTYDVASRREAQRHRIRQSLLSLREIAEYSTADRAAFGARLSVKQLEGWVRRRRLIRRGSRPNDRHGEEALYAPADVIELVDERRAG